MLDLMMKRRSIRKFKPQAIEQEKVDQILKAALWAPTSRNSRPWEFVLVTDREKLEKLAVSKPGGHALKSAALGIVVLGDADKSDVWIEDTSIATITMIYTAETLGLGSCWVQIRERFHDKEKTITSEQYVRELLNIPENKKVLSIVAMGYPDETRAPHTEDELDYSKVYYEEYGKTK